MSLGNLLLQPQRLQRQSGGDPRLEVAQDVLRLLTLLAEDAGDGGPLAGVMPELVTRVGGRIQARAESGIEGVFSALKGRFQPIFLYFEGLVDQVETLETDPTATITLIRGIVDGIRALLDSTSQAQIQSQLDFVKGLLEQQLGIDPPFVNHQIGLLLDDLVDLWNGLPSDISPRRRRRLAIGIVQRLRRHLIDQFTLPAIDTARAASQLYQTLRSTGIREIFAEIHCVLDRFDEAVDAVDDIRDALPLNVGGDSVGAALIQPEGSAVYCWYASWLLSEVDLPLVGIGEIKDKKLFVNLFRTHRGISVKTETISRFFFSTLTDVQQQSVIDFDGTSEPDDELVRMLVAHLNHYMQLSPIFQEERFGSTAVLHGIPQSPILVPFTFTLMHDVERIRPNDHWPEELRTLQRDYVGNQELLLYNRRFLEWAFGPTVIKTLCGDFWRYLGRKTIGLTRKVFISGNGRYLMVDDMPVYSVPEGATLKWEEAPLFIDKGSTRTPPPGTTWYSFRRVPALACDIIAQILYGLEQTARPIWHLVDLQPGHQVGTGIISGIDILYSLNDLFLGKPMKGYESIGGFGDWLVSDLYGPRALALFGGSFQGLHTAATAGNGWWFWVTVVLGDYIRLFGHNSSLRTLRDIPLSFFTLLNSSASNSGDTSLARNPAANHKKQEGIVGPTNLLFIFLLMKIYKRQNHSIEIWSADDIGGQRAEAFGLWFGGGIGFGILAGATGCLLSQLIAWQLDWKRFGITIAESVGLFFFGYWFFEYLFKEGDTGDGTYALTGSYKGYPAKVNSPYRLPMAAGEALYMGQGNNGMFSHNSITNMGGNWQVYAFDLGHDHRQVVRAMRSGVVWSFTDTFADNNDQNANFIIIRHDTLVPDHDDARGTGTPLVTFARYWHGAQNGVTNVFPGPIVQESVTAGSGTPVTQGQIIMEADDTGTSFHSHLHIYVVVADGTGNPGSESIPFVFEDVDNDSGLMEFLTWYRAGA